MTRIKVCGMTSVQDAMAAVELGAQAIGLIFYQPSPRGVTPETALAIVRALPPFVTAVGVFVNERAAVVREVVGRCGLTALQFHGDEAPAYCAEFGTPVIKAFRVSAGWDPAALAPYQVSAYLLDTYAEGLYGGTGLAFPWEAAEAARRRGRVILAGGLAPETVGAAIARVRPYAVDVCSGVEAAPGRKDLSRLRAFVEAVQAADRAAGPDPGPETAGR